MSKESLSNILYTRILIKCIEEKVNPNLNEIIHMIYDKKIMIDPYYHKYYKYVNISSKKYDVRLLNALCIDA